MKKWTNFAVVLALLVGGCVGYGISRFQSHQAINARLNLSIYQFWGDLHAAEMDSKQFGSNPTTPLELAYVNNYKIHVAQASALWQSMTTDLVQEGIPSSEVDQVTQGLLIIYNNILPPYGMSETSKTVLSARSWISLFARSLDVIPSISSRNYISILKGNINKIVQSYKSLSSDGNFQVPPN